MSLSEIPGKVSIPRTLPVGLLIAAIVGGTLFWRDTNSTLSTLELRIKSLESDMRDRDRAERAVSERLGRMEEQVRAQYEILREIREAMLRRPPGGP